ncbi:hypothetical protein LTR10_010189 [Elasticomyces elasticus]|nr:hypothetical protein LTR10_010189 [Elasticomyces elasticus]KAK4972093.1 hypothetical protein LTR42_006599 [Elasticomyces elasticus]
MRTTRIHDDDLAPYGHDTIHDCSECQFHAVDTFDGSTRHAKAKVGHDTHYILQHNFIRQDLHQAPSPTHELQKEVHRLWTLFQAARHKPVPWPEFMNHFAVLNLPVSATRDEIDEACRQCVLDNNAGTMSTAFITKANELDGAIVVLTHPVKKKVYDRHYLVQLKKYESRRIMEMEGDDARRRVELAKAGLWRKSLLYGHERHSPYDEEVFGRVSSLQAYDGRERELSAAASGWAGNVIAGWIEGMEVKLCTGKTAKVRSVFCCYDTHDMHQHELRVVQIGLCDRFKRDVSIERPFAASLMDVDNIEYQFEVCAWKHHRQGGLEA